MKVIEPSKPNHLSRNDKATIRQQMRNDARGGNTQRKNAGRNWLAAMDAAFEA